MRDVYMIRGLFELSGKQWAIIAGIIVVLIVVVLLFGKKGNSN